MTPPTPPNETVFTSVSRHERFARTAAGVMRYSRQLSASGTSTSTVAATDAATLLGVSGALAQGDWKAYAAALLP